MGADDESHKGSDGFPRFASPDFISHTYRPPPPGQFSKDIEGCWHAKGSSYLCDTLLMLSSIQHRPRNTTRILSLQEERLGFAVLEAKDLAVAADVEFTLFQGR